MVPWMAFDVETAPMPGCADYLTDPIEAPANYKDPLKIAAYIENARQKQIDDAGLDLDLCEVVAIAGQFHDTGWCQTLETWTEGDMLDGFWRFVRTIQREGGNLVGFGCLTFDLPVLLRRSLYLGIDTPSISIDRFRHDGVIDVLDVLSFGRKDFMRSLAFYARRFNLDVPADPHCGADIAGLVAAKEWAAVEAHCKADAWSTAQLAARIGLVSQPQPNVIALDVVA